jgi:hypothetical protein
MKKHEEEVRASVVGSADQDRFGPPAPSCPLSRMLIEFIIDVYIYI